MSLSGDSPSFVSFLSDYGLGDEFVGVCKAVMLRLAPQLRVIDVTHDVPPHDVRSGALTLARCAQYLPGGLVLAVVDPGVGTARRAIAAQVEGSYLVGPDNGLLAPAVAMLGGASRAVDLTNSRFQLPAPSPTFAGRDVFAPAVAHLANGVDLHELGDPIDPVTLQPGVLPLPNEEGQSLVGEVLWVDRFGNVQTNIDPAELITRGAKPGSVVRVGFRDERRIARWVTAYGDAKSGELVTLVDSYGLVSLALDRRSVADELELRVGSLVTLAVEVGTGEGA